MAIMHAISHATEDGTKLLTITWAQRSGGHWMPVKLGPESVLGTDRGGLGCLSG
ncbi:unnamed protein product [marine sediment metagenome]|uniref:Uncharacterized protein n=1 Tax=marine sediment metagenome TaxID=412755 RepID=X0T650_9ZZZZ